MQFELFEKSWAEQFEDWVHTPGGRHIADRIIRAAWRYWRRGRRMGMKALWEQERWRFKELKRYAAGRGIRLRKVDGYAFNNNFTAYMSSFVEMKEPRLKGFFEKRERGRKGRSERMAVVVPINERKAS